MEGARVDQFPRRNLDRLALQFERLHLLTARDASTSESSGISEASCAVSSAVPQGERGTGKFRSVKALPLGRQRFQLLRGNLLQALSQLAGELIALVDLRDSLLQLLLVLGLAKRFGISGR